MKKLIGSLLFASSLNATAQITKANLITFEANKNKQHEVSEFLKKGANIVSQTEKDTIKWYALTQNNNQFAIFDSFTNAKAQAKHFEGKVANALHQAANNLIKNGWDRGIVNNINDYNVLATSLSKKNCKMATEATYIILHAKPGMEKQLEDLLINAANIINKTEPDTLYWTSLKLNSKTFAIFDTFTHNQGRNKHFNGKVAATLKNKSSSLIEGGWENGVLKNVHHYQIIAGF